MGLVLTIKLKDILSSANPLSQQGVTLLHPHHTSELSHGEAQETSGAALEGPVTMDLVSFMVEEVTEAEVEEVAMDDVTNRARDQIDLEHHLQVVSTQQKVSIQNMKPGKDSLETSDANAMAGVEAVEDITEDTEENGDVMDVEDQRPSRSQESREALT